MFPWPWATTATWARSAKPGSAPRKASSALGIWIGTGIGAGFVRKGRLWRGARESAGEIGHIVMQIGGPTCGCGNRGCLEALASRSAIERDIREALASGRTSILAELGGGDLSVIRSGAIRRALEAEDPLVSEVVRHASEVIGHACLTVRHLIDPEVIVLGGGVIEACSDFMMPIVENIVGSDRLPGARDGGQVFLSALGDDAVVLGAVALARKLVGRSPFKKRFAVAPRYPEIVRAGAGEITVGRKTYRRDVYIPVNGKTKKRGKSLCARARRRRASHSAEGIAEGLPRRAGNSLRRRRQGGKDRVGRRGPAVFEPACDSLRGLADGPGRGGLQPVEAAQGRLDARDVLIGWPRMASYPWGNPP